MNTIILSLPHLVGDPLLLGLYTTIVLSILSGLTYHDLCRKDKLKRFVQERARALLPVKEYVIQPAGKVIDTTSLAESISVDQII